MIHILTDCAQVYPTGLDAKRGVVVVFLNRDVRPLPAVLLDGLLGKSLARRFIVTRTYRQLGPSAHLHCTAVHKIPVRPFK